MQNDSKSSNVVETLVCPSMSWTVALMGGCHLTSGWSLGI